MVTQPTSVKSSPPQTHQSTSLARKPSQIAESAKSYAVKRPRPRTSSTPREHNYSDIPNILPTVEQDNPKSIQFDPTIKPPVTTFLPITSLKKGSYSIKTQSNIHLGQNEEVTLFCCDLPFSLNQSLRGLDTQDILFKDQILISRAVIGQNIILSLTNNSRDPINIPSGETLFSFFSFMNHNNTDILVGPPMKMPLTIENTVVNALIDTGSQVSLVTRKFYEDKLRHLKLHPVTNSSLVILGAGGNNIPYLGTIYSNIIIPPELGKNSGAITAGLFVIPENPALENIPLIVGTNILTHYNVYPSMSTHVNPPEVFPKFHFGEVSNSNAQWCNSLNKELGKRSQAFIRSEFDIGRASVGEFDMELLPGPDIRERPRPIPPQDVEELREHLKGLLDAKIIKPSNSPYASPVVLVRKKSGALRMCVDYRKLNARTVKDSYSIPKIEDLLLTLNNAKYFTTLDLCKAYYQVPMSEKAQKYSAFCTVFGNYEWERLSQGLSNAPACFQRIMENIFGDVNLSEMIIFLDDILIHGNTLEELEARTLRVLDRLIEYGLKLDPDKCIFGATTAKHLGYVISNGEIRPDPEKIAVVKEWPRPQTVKDIKRFIGFAGFYRRFIPNFASVARPLNQLTTGYVPKKKSKSKKKVGSLNLSSSIVDSWGDLQESAFQKIIDALTSTLVLGLADRSKPFILHCDASGVGLGAILYQEFDGEHKVIAYASRGLSKSEQNYAAHKREFLALKWAMVDKFRDYLLGTKVTVVTDNNPLCYILKNAKLDATSHRWLAALSIFDFDLKYKKGESHVDADSLSRLPVTEPDEDDEYLETVDKIQFLLDKAKQFDDEKGVVKNEGIVVNSCVQALFQLHCVDSESSTQVNPAVEQLSIDVDKVPDDILEPNIDIDSFPTIDWKSEQRRDSQLSHIIECIEQGTKLECNNRSHPSSRVFAREQKRLFLDNGVLYRKTILDDNSERSQLVLPFAYRKSALRGCHEDLFHTHFDGAIAQLRSRFFWPFMARDLQNKIKSCIRCVKRGARCEKAPMASIVTSYPLELLSIDYLTINVNGKKENVLVMMDHFTKFGHAVVTKDQTARTVARTLWHEFFMLYGFPSRILSDQGKDFQSQLVKEICNVAGIEKCRTTPYHPAGNPVERWNRTLLGMLRSLEDDVRLNLKQVLPQVVHAYNCCVHESTGYSPYFLFFGRQPRLPIDLAFGLSTGSTVKGMSTSQYVRNLKQGLSNAYKRATEAMKKSSAKNKARYDLSARAATLEAGDRVLVRKLGPRLNSKLTDRWEKEVYVVVSKRDDLPVYTVRTEKNDGPSRTLHRNYLLPIGYLEETIPISKVKVKTKGVKNLRPTNENSRCYEFDTYDNTCTNDYVLRIEAPEFIPQTQNVIQSSPPNTTSVNMDLSLNDDNVPTHVNLNSLNENDAEFDDEIVIDNESDVDNDNDSILSGESPSDRESPRVPEIITCRRSLRERKPVVRLNLSHFVPHNFSTFLCIAFYIFLCLCIC